MEVMCFKYPSDHSRNIFIQEWAHLRWNAQKYFFSHRNSNENHGSEGFANPEMTNFLKFRSPFWRLRKKIQLIYFSSGVELSAIHLSPAFRSFNIKIALFMMETDTIASLIGRARCWEKCSKTSQLSLLDSLLWNLNIFKICTDPW